MSGVWPDADGKLVARFVESLKLKHITTACAYRSSILKPFQTFVRCHAGDQPFGPATIVSWLQATTSS